MQGFYAVFPLGGKIWGWGSGLHYRAILGNETCVFNHSTFGNLWREGKRSKRDVQRLGCVECFSDFLKIVLYCPIRVSSASRCYQILPIKSQSSFFFPVLLSKGTILSISFPFSWNFPSCVSDVLLVLFVSKYQQNSFSFQIWHRRTRWSIFLAGW